MRRYHAKRSGEITRYALTQGFSVSFTSRHGETVTLSREGRGKPFLVTVIRMGGNELIEERELGRARVAFAEIKRQLESKL